MLVRDCDVYIMWLYMRGLGVVIVKIDNGVLYICMCYMVFLLGCGAD